MGKNLYHFLDVLGLLTGMETGISQTAHSNPDYS